MSIDVAARRPSLAEWDRVCDEQEDAYEFVDGVPTVAPPEAFRNIDAAALHAK